ncbi:GNAT family N-acetyltransferase [Thalassotalea crassostreae]|uniref:GNAT family N-acetyltransferase n=1 Tax=Thalassotalea crassostreae TaxID=1763536 RepID=UPI000839662F|nr:N-acetyltransferase [Thalassotalea crassostreae]
MKIRNEKIDEHQQIFDVIEQAFIGHPFSDNKEQFIVDKLRKDDGLTVSLVAVEDNNIVGHIAFSKVLVDGQDKQYFGLAPVTVLPSKQGRGIGKALIEAGLERIKSIGGRTVVLLGEPEYYQRFGFRNYAELILEGVPAQYFMALNLNGENVSEFGVVTYHPAFSG